MASVKLYLDTRHRRMDGTYPVKLAVNHKKSFLMNLGIYLHENEWIDNAAFLSVDPKKQKTLNEYIGTRLSSASNTLYKLRALGRLQ